MPRSLAGVSIPGPLQGLLYLHPVRPAIHSLASLPRGSQQKPPTPFLPALLRAPHIQRLARAPQKEPWVSCQLCDLG